MAIFVPLISFGKVAKKLTDGFALDPVLVDRTLGYGDVSQKDQEKIRKQLESRGLVYGVDFRWRANL